MTLISVTGYAWVRRDREKPLVLNPWNIDALAEVERETGHKVNNILQLRLHDSIKALKKRIDEGPKDKVYRRGSDLYHFSR